MGGGGGGGVRRGVNLRRLYPIMYGYIERRRGGRVRGEEEEEEIELY